MSIFSLNSSRIFSSILAGLGLLFSPLALAELTPISWDSGKIYIEGEQVVIRYEGGARLLLSNLTAVTDPDGRKRITIATPSAEGQNVRDLIGSFRHPNPDDPLPTLLTRPVERVGSSPRILMVYWNLLLHNDRISRSTGLAEIAVQVNPDGTARILDSNTFSPYSASFSGQEISHPVVLANGRQYIFLYHRFTGDLSVIRVEEKPSPNGENHYSDYSQSHHLLPAGFRSGRPFTEGGQVQIDRDASRIVLRTSDHNTIILASGLPSSEGSDGEHSSMDQWIAQRRVDWAQDHSCSSYLSSRITETGAEIPVTAAIDGWMNELQSTTNPRQPYAGDRNEYRSSVSYLFFTLSRAVQAQFPDARFRIAQQVLAQSNRLIQTHHPNSIFYIRIPVNAGGLAHLNTVAEEVANQAAAGMNESSGIDRNHLFLIDLLDSGGTQEYREVGDSIQYLVSKLEQHGILKAKLVFLSRPDQTSRVTRAGGFQERAERITQISVDRHLTENQRLDVVSRGIAFMGHPMEHDVLSRLLSAIHLARSSRADTFADLSAVVQNLSAALASPLVSPTDASFIPLMATRYALISGDRRVGPFPREALARASQIRRSISSAFSNGTPSGRITGRDQLLETLEGQILGWVHTGYRAHPTLPLFFLGDNGTGKTQTAEKLVEALGAAVERVNLSSFGPPTRFGQTLGLDPDETGESPALHEIREKVQRLVLTPNPRELRVLIIDELDKHLSVLRDLLPAFGDGDRRGTARVNLDGLIVIIAGNVNTSSEAYRELCRMTHYSDPTRLARTRQLARDSLVLSDRNPEGVSETLFGAVIGRILTGLHFFAPISTDRNQQVSLIERLMTDFESTHQIRIVVQESAQEYLTALAASSETANFRGVERAIDAALSEAFGRYHASHLGETRSGYFILRSGRSITGMTQLQVLSVSEDRDGIGVSVEDSYDRTLASIRDATAEVLEELRGTPSDASDRVENAATRRIYEIFLSAFRKASSAPLFLGEGRKTADTIFTLMDSIPYPAALAGDRRRTFGTYLEQSIHHIFNIFANPSHPLSETRTPAHRSDVILQIQRLLQGLQTLSRIDQEDSVGKTPDFGRWVEACRLHYNGKMDPSTSLREVVETLSRPTHELGVAAASLRRNWVEIEPVSNIDAGTLDALAIASGYFANQLARNAASIRFSDLTAEAIIRQEREREARESGARPAPPGSSAQRECMGALVTTGQAVAREINGILSGRH